MEAHKVPTNFFRSIQKLFFWFVIFLIVANPSFAETKLKVGIVPQFTAQELRMIWDPILIKIAKESGVSFTIIGSPSIPAFEKKLMRGEFDLVYLNPYHMVMAHDAHNYQPIVRDIGRSLRGILVVRKDSGITNISQLQNQVLAFPAPNALGASLLMRAELANVHGLNIKPNYVKTHSSTYLNVMLGQAKAGGGVMKTLNKQAKNIKDALRIIYKTQKVSPHPIALHPRVSKDVRMKITKALLTLDSSKQGRAMLSKIPMKKIGRANMSDYKALESMGLEKFVIR